MGNVLDYSTRTSITVLGQVTGVVSAAQVQTTSGSYQVIATVGESSGSVVSSSAGGLKIYNNVAGNMNSFTTTTVVK